MRAILHAVASGMMTLGAWDATRSWPLVIGVVLMCFWSYLRFE